MKKLLLPLLWMLTVVLTSACDSSLPDSREAGESHEGRAVISSVTPLAADTLSLTTRADAADFEDYIAVLQRAANEDDAATAYTEVRRFEGAAIVSQLQGQTLTLTEGDYRLQLYSIHYNPAMADTLVSAPTYYGDQTFTIRANETTTVPAIVSRQTHIGLTVSFTDAVRTHFTGTLTLTDTNSLLTWTATLPGPDEQTVYFPATAKLTYTLSLTNTDAESFRNTSAQLQEYDALNFHLTVDLAD